MHEDRARPVRPPSHADVGEPARRPPRSSARSRRASCRARSSAGRRRRAAWSRRARPPPRRRAWSSPGRRGSRCTKSPLSWLPATPQRSKPSNAAVTRVQAERLPALPAGRVVAGVEHRGRTAGVARSRARPRPCRCCRGGRRPGRRRSRRRRAAAARGRRRPPRPRVEHLALVVGVDRALDQPPRSEGGRRRCGPRRPATSLGHRRRPGRGSRPATSRPARRPPVGSRRATAATAGGDQQQDDARAGTPRRVRTAANRSRRRGGADQHPHQDRHQPERRAAQAGGHRHVDQRAAHLRDLALRLAGDVGVPLDQRLGGLGVGLAQADVDADPAARSRAGGRAAPVRCAGRRTRRGSAG